MPYRGELLALLAPLAWAVAVILYRRAGERVPPVAMNLFKNALVTPLFFVCYALSSEVAPQTGQLQAFALLLTSGAVGITLGACRA